VPIPVLTEERRKELVKHLHGMRRRSPRGPAQHPARRQRGSTKKLLKDKRSARTTNAAPSTTSRKLTDANIQKLDQAAKGREKEILEIK
jgi:ribosome recycling factor